MKKCILLILVLLFIPTVQAEPLAVSYWGYVSIDGITKSGALVTVYDNSGKELASTTSIQDATYQVTVPFDDPATQSDEGAVDGETITFKVNGKDVSSRAIGAKGTNNRLDLSFTESSSSSSSGSGSSSGGGGGGTVSSEPSENVLKKENREDTLAKDVAKTFSFSTPELAVSQIVITSNINTEPVSVQVELLKERSSIAKENAAGTVYKYINIYVGTAGSPASKNIKEAVVKFKLENSWIKSNDFADSDIVLQKWDGTQWIKLETSKKNSDDNYTFYEAKTDAFSAFAITGVKEETAASAASPESTTSAETPLSTTQAAAKSAPGFGIIAAIAVLAIVILIRRY